MAKPKQDEMFPQKKIAAIEKWCDKADERREQIISLTEEKENFEFKMREAVHANEADVDHQESEDGDKLLIYARGPYKVVVKRGKETVNYKRKEAAKGEAPEEGTAE